MIGFITCCVTLALLVQNQNPYLLWLETDASLGIGLGLAGMSLVLGYLKKCSTSLWHDGFCIGGLLIWYAWWRPEFDAEAPMFFFFPLYYALLTAFLTLTLVNRSRDFDAESVIHLRYLEKIFRFDIFSIVLLVMVSLLITRHYALYPMAMTFFIIRHTVIVCLENVDSSE